MAIWNRFRLFKQIPKYTELIIENCSEGLFIRKIQ